MAIEALEGVTDQELFNDANGDEEIADEAVSEEPQAEQVEQPRDEAGRFAERAAEPEPAPERPATVDDNAAMVPSWRVREINEEKRTLAEKVSALEVERLQWQQRQQAPQPVAEVKVEKPDPLLDPEGYEKYLETKFEERILNNQREASLAQAHRTYKTEFEEAYAAAQKQVDPVLKMKMQNSRDPGETLIEWHREQKTKSEIGNDLSAYKQRLREEALKDPEFRKVAMQAWRSDAQQAPTGRQAISLPPSLTRATNASADVSADDNDISDEGLWRHVNA